MQEEKKISGATEEQIWEQINTNFKQNLQSSEYHVVLDQNGRRVLLDIINNPDGTSSSTTFSAYLYNRNEFRFAIHNQSFIDEIGKFFGMQDFVTGYKEFDEHFIVKTNDEQNETRFCYINMH